MSDIVKSSLTALIAGERPSPSAIQACFTAIMDGDVGQAQMAAFLIALKMRGEQVDDIAAAAGVMRDKALKIHASDDAMDIVGTGGDGFGTYNISTASAFVIAGCGIPVAKHGNKAVSSKSGAADVLSALGIKLDCDMALVERALAKNQYYLFDGTAPSRSDASCCACSGGTWRADNFQSARPLIQSSACQTHHGRCF